MPDEETQDRTAKQLQRFVMQEDISCAAYGCRHVSSLGVEVKYLIVSDVVRDAAPLGGHNMVQNKLDF